MKQKDTLLTRRVEKVLPSKSQLQKLMSTKKLRVYIGVDPTASQLHLGHTIGWRKLMEFANAGHEAILLFGTGTVMVGDPSFRDEARKLISEEEINNNIKTWKKQAAKVIDFKKVTIKKNGDWLSDMTLKDLIAVASNISAVQLFKRESFTRRIEAGNTVWYHETMYPLLQGYDSVVMDVDLEIGGTDQEFNMLMGRELQKKMNNREKYVLTTPLVLGTDGRKMSKSYGNCIWIEDSAKEMFGKLMTVNDELITYYYEMFTDFGSEKIAEVEKRLKKGANPRDEKADMAKEVIKLFHTPAEAEAAAEAFSRQFSENQLPEKIPEVQVSKAEWDLADLLVQTGLADSKSQARRVLTQGGVKLNQEVVESPQITLKSGDILQVGKRRFKKVIL